MKKHLVWSTLQLMLLIFSCQSQAQELKDTLKLEEITIGIYPLNKNLFNTPSSGAVLDKDQLALYTTSSLVSALNSLPGIRMEERSPGSYRLSIRGSLLRSPFGIRNVKVYIDEIPLTDAGGNTYLNSLDPLSITHIEILKGPQGSLFGTNTGGVVIINPASYIDSQKISLTLNGGSFGLIHEKISIENKWTKYKFRIVQAFQKSHGYRDHSKLQRKYIHAIQQWNYHKKTHLRVFTLYSDLNYQTPGGLTLSQFQTNPKSARKPTSVLPGAEEQKAGIFNETLLAGIIHEAFIKTNLRHILSLFGNSTNFKNPFITNYEVRKENTIGFRSYLELKGKSTDFIFYKWNLGVEWQKTYSLIHNYGNNKGSIDSIQKSDKVNAQQHFYFSQLHAAVGSHIIIEAGLSLNYFLYAYKTIFPAPSNQPHLNFTTKVWSHQLMPKIAVLYKINNNLNWRASVSRGFSPPTLSEIRPSNNIFYSQLEAETGWNYETGFRVHFNQWFYADLTAFYFKLNNAIVRRLDNNGIEYFQNAGGTKQPGMELQLVSSILKSKNNFIKGLELTNSLTYYSFTFKDYKNNTNNYSGNDLTGVPALTVVTGMQVFLPINISLFVQHNYTSRIPLNDNNLDYAENYNLIQLKSSWKYKLSKKTAFELFIGIDNLLNEKYSLGNDLNAAGGRYYNAAPSRNYFTGLTFNF